MQTAMFKSPSSHRVTRNVSDDHKPAANAEWDPPGGVFDADVLVQPGTLSNVENGFGFVGAGYRLSSTWIPLDTIIVGDSYFGF